MEKKVIAPILFDFFNETVEIGSEVVFASNCGLKHGVVKGLVDAEGTTMLDVRSLLHPRRWQYVNPDYCVVVSVSHEEERP